MRFYPLIAAGAMVCSVILIRPTTAAETYELDGAHCDVSFRISHLQLSYTAGRFGDVRGGFVLDPAQPANASFIVQINAASIDTNNAKRDEHLRSPDFFNAKQFPGISFRSTRVQPIQG